MLHYFDEQSADKCGHCDVCITNKTKSTVKYRVDLIALLREKSNTLEGIRSHFSKYNDEAWLKEFHDLVEEGIIVLNDRLYSLKE